MKKSVIKTAKTTRKAIDEALQELNLREDEVEIEILEEEKTGLFGIIGTKDAVVRISYEENAMDQLNKLKEEILNDTFSDINVDFDAKENIEEFNPSQEDEEKIKEELDNNSLEDNIEKIDKDLKKDLEDTHKKEDIEKIDSKVIKESEDNNLEEKEDLEEENKEVLKDDKELSDVEKYYKAKKLVEDIFYNMHIDAKVYGNLEDDIIKLNVKVDSKDTGIAIGRRADTLKAIELIVRKAINKSDRLPKISIDVNNYKKRRDDKIRAIANSSAKKVLKSKRDLKLRAMNAYERRLVHTEIANYDKLLSHSEGKDPNRFVVIEYKKD